MGSLFSPWGLGVIFQVLMLIHFFRHRPEWYWLFVIFFLGPLGALIYFVVEVIPGMNWKPPAVERLERNRRRRRLEMLVADSPSQQALSELAAIRARGGDHEGAIKLFSDALARDPEDIESLFGRGLSRAALGDHADAIADLAAVVALDPAHAFHRARLALAEEYEAAGDDARGAAEYRAVLDRTTVSQAYYGLARLLAKEGRAAEARNMLQEILNKQADLPRYLRRQERPWARRAKGLLKTLAEQ